VFVSSVTFCLICSTPATSLEIILYFSDFSQLSVLFFICSSYFAGYSPSGLFHCKTAYALEVRESFSIPDSIICKSEGFFSNVTAPISLFVICSSFCGLVILLVHLNVPPLTFCLFPPNVVLNS